MKRADFLAEIVRALTFRFDGIEPEFSVENLLVIKAFVGDDWHEKISNEIWGRYYKTFLLVTFEKGQILGCYYNLFLICNFKKDKILDLLIFNF